LVIGYWLLVIGYWLLVIGYWLHEQLYNIDYQVFFLKKQHKSQTPHHDKAARLYLCEIKKQAEGSLNL
jgi:hypothetical protein